jgi:hypoxanthine phosphoribosyltransferase
VASLAREINAQSADRPIHVVGVLRGAFIFMADLVRALATDANGGGNNHNDVRCDFLGVRSYGSTTESSGVVAITSDLGLPIAGQHVLLIEDIVDTGLTLRYLLDLLATRHPASIQVCSLLNKPSRRRVEVSLDFFGFEIPDLFVVGYGLDYDQRYRNLPYIGVLSPSARESKPALP